MTVKSLKVLVKAIIPYKSYVLLSHCYVIQIIEKDKAMCYGYFNFVSKK